MTKHLVVCADGTWNRVETANVNDQWVSTNVSKIAVSLSRCTADGIPQVCRYLKGVGTEEEEGVTGGAFGWGLSANVLAGYRFLIENYVEGDKIYLFGFSRGAYTARSLAGLILHAGILKNPAPSLIEKAMEIYRDRTEATKFDGMRARIFRLENSHDVEIEMIGVWDTVGSLGVPLLGNSLAHDLGWAWRFHDVSLGPHIRHAYHALAIHEKRSKFLPSLWHLPDGSGSTLRQVWFSGVHSDIGGGYSKSGLADTTLDWMISRATSHGLEFKIEWRDLRVSGQKLISKDATPILHDSFHGITALFDRLPWAKGGGRSFRRTDISEKTNEFIHHSVLDQFENATLLKSNGERASWPRSFAEVLEDIHDGKRKGDTVID